MFEAEGIFTRADKDVMVEYMYEQERAILHIQNKAMMMKRASISMYFIPNKETEAFLQVGGITGKIPVHTHSFLRTRTDCGYHITLEYELGFPNAPKLYRIELEIKIFDGRVIS